MPAYEQKATPTETPAFHIKLAPESSAKVHEAPLFEAFRPRPTPPETPEHQSTRDLHAIEPIHITGTLCELLTIWTILLKNLE